MRYQSLSVSLVRVLLYGKVMLCPNQSQDNAVRMRTLRGAPIQRHKDELDSDIVGCEHSDGGAYLRYVMCTVPPPSPNHPDVYGTR